MHRNTAILLGILVVLVTLVGGVKIGQLLNPTPPLATPTPAPLVASATPQPSPKTLTHSRCRLSLTYPAAYELTEASDSATLVPPGTVDLISERIVLLCGVEFPKPPLPADKIETATIAGQLATVYHDASARDGAPVDIVVFNHPQTQMEIALFGFGDVFEAILASVRFN